MSDKVWNIRNVPVDTQRKIKTYASSQGKTIAEVLTEVAEKL